MANRWGTGRTEAFSDGVFAIAITLLVLEISVPESDFRDLWNGIGHQWPSYLGFVTSFVTIGGIWLAHHGIFRRLRFVNARVMQVNLLLLLVVTFLPFPTRLMAQAIRDQDAERAAVVFYGASLFVTALAVAALWGAVLSDRGILRPEVGDAEITAVTRATTPNVAFYGAAIGLGVLAPRVAVFVYLAIGLAAVFRARGDSTYAAEAPAPED